MGNTQAATSAQAAEKFPSFNWMRGVLDEHRISIIHRLILIRILIHRQKDGQCDPGYDAVAEELGVNRKTAMRAVDVAVRFGWLAPPVRGRRENARFVFIFPADQEVRLEGTSRANQEVRPDELRSPSKRVKKSVKKRAFRATSKTSTGHGHLTGKERKNGQKNQTRAPVFASPDSKQESGEQEPFRQFWSAYPKRVAKEAARKAFAAALKGGAEPDVLIAGAARYAVERAGQDPRFTKHPSTWLSAGCWSDEPAGDVVIDEAGNVVAVAYEQPRQQSTGRGFATLAQELDDELAATGREWF